jgi:hypothetical protein
MNIILVKQSVTILSCHLPGGTEENYEELIDL